MTESSEDLLKNGEKTLDTLSKEEFEIVFFETTGKNNVFSLTLVGQKSGIAVSLHKFPKDLTEVIPDVVAFSISSSNMLPRWTFDILNRNDESILYDKDLFGCYMNGLMPTVLKEGVKVEKETGFKEKIDKISRLLVETEKHLLSEVVAVAS